MATRAASRLEESSEQYKFLAVLGNFNTGYATSVLSDRGCLTEIVTDSHNEKYTAIYSVSKNILDYRQHS